ncbi:MAG: ATP-binding protein [Oscillospiraceae bacterium]|jgi:AAA+ ATPase superfamily predicted ATPase|nr:ATP-binding protein [Oscillospiraceae bacterium]
MKRFVNREWELNSLNQQYNTNGSSFVVIYGRRRVGKTTLIHEFVKDKPTLYFHASEESDEENRKDFALRLAELTGKKRDGNVLYNNWYDIIDVFTDYHCKEKKVLVIDELPYLVHANPAFPTILQKIWDTGLQYKNVMLILCGSLVHMMEKCTLNYGSPLYGRRTGQMKVMQIDFQHYAEFFDDMKYRDLVEHYAVTGGIPRYIELFKGKEKLVKKIERLILERDSILYEEPEFLLRHEVEGIGSYLSILKSIASGNHRLSKISDDIGVKQTSLPKYLKTMIDLDILEREVPITESNLERRKTSLYQIKDNFLRFWFRFVYSERSRLELGQKDVVLEKIKANFIDNHVAHIYEYVCRSELWRLNREQVFDFNRLGRWWNSKEEIDIVALGDESKQIIFAECKYRSKPMDIDVFTDLLRKKDLVSWNDGCRSEIFVLFSISGFTDSLTELSKVRDDLLLIGGEGTY